METAEVAIVGGGAAGLTAAIFAAQAGGPSCRVVVLDGARSLGSKILASGGGRCNVTHETVTAGDYHGARNIVRNVLAAFGQAPTVRWFASLGVPLKREETGKLFPATDSARTVLAALLARCQELGVILHAGTRVTGISTSPGDPAPFTIATSAGTRHASRVILATGGRSLPKTGSDGSGWELARRLGHSVTPTYPALVPLVLEKGFFHAGLAGISQEVELSTWVAGKRIDQRKGSLLWTHFGISGPVVLDASRFWVSAWASGQHPRLTGNFFAPEGFEAVERWLLAQASAHPRTALARILAERLVEKVAASLIRQAGLDPALTAGQLAREARRTLVHTLTALPLPATGPRGWDEAEVTAGGVPLNEIDYATMESRRVPGLYLAGEMLDCDGRLGGFNFQWAWSTGYLAGTAAGKAGADRPGP